MVNINILQFLSLLNCQTSFCCHSTLVFVLYLGHTRYYFSLFSNSKSWVHVFFFKITFFTGTLPSHRCLIDMLHYASTPFQFFYLSIFFIYSYLPFLCLFILIYLYTSPTTATATPQVFILNPINLNCPSNSNQSIWCGINSIKYHGVNRDL